MNVFSCHFRGARVSVIYDGDLGGEIFWIANVILDGHAQSIDGAFSVQSTHIQADITRAVIRGLEWVSGRGGR
ncbi:hypothetical protein [Dyella amyloliquefaciens]|uniref:hypothetical protein n=1 Tax=Dyella amyloliquefaciens TaxID=1770545 RepID=UPI0013EEDD09|nr:hypothetical protein [Dyella amyloliquefaciens]